MELKGDNTMTNVKQTLMNKFKAHGVRVKDVGYQLKGEGFRAWINRSNNLTIKKSKSQRSYSGWLDDEVFKAIMKAEEL